MLFETFAGHAGVLLENGRLEQSLAQVTELKEELRHQAYHDALTGLPNRVLFAERVDRGARRAARDGERRHAVLFLDLDDFKIVNDSWGHAVGDELLVQVAERLRGTRSGPATRPPGSAATSSPCCSRTPTPPRPSDVAQRIRDALAAPFWLSGREASVHASIGIA